MFLQRAMAATLAIAAIVVNATGPVCAQSLAPPAAPANPPFQLGPVVIAPSVLTNLGYDSNVFNREDNVQGDSTAMFVPSLDVWLRLPRARLYSNSRFDFYYYKELTDLRAIDTDFSGRLDVPLNRLTPYVDGSVENTRQSQNLEIDALAQRRTNTATAGVDLRLTGKITADVFARRAGLEYEPDSLYQDTDLAAVMNYSSSGEGGGVRYALTPFTSLAVYIEQYRDRFDTQEDRDADSLEITPSVEIKPFALVSGRVAIGYRNRKFLGGDVPDFNGTEVFADLTYTFRERTRFGFGGRRELQYSYVIGHPDYLVGELNGLVTQRVGERWDAGASVGHAKLTYSQPKAASGTPPNPASTASPSTTPAATPTSIIPDETVLTYGVNVGYNFGQTRAGFQMDYRTRLANQAASERGYERLRIGTSVTHSF